MYICSQSAHAVSTDTALLIAQGRALAVLTVLFSRCSEEQIATVAAAVPGIQSLLQSSNRVVQANACAALTAASAINDDLAVSIADQSTSQLVSLLQECCSGQDQQDLQLNVVSALGQLARDQQPVVEALLEPDGPERPAKLQEAVTDSLCALAASRDTREHLIAAGVVPLVARLLTAEHLEVSVRSLMVLGMLCSSNHTAQQQLAEEEAALQQLILLLKQQEDMDCKVSDAFVGGACPGHAGAANEG
eukprot:gene5442-5673_t